MFGDKYSEELFSNRWDEMQQKLKGYLGLNTTEDSVKFLKKFKLYENEDDGPVTLSRSEFLD